MPHRAHHLARVALVLVAASLSACEATAPDEDRLVGVWATAPRVGEVYVDGVDHVVRLYASYELRADGSFVHRTIVTGLDGRRLGMRAVASGTYSVDGRLRMEQHAFASAVDIADPDLEPLPTEPLAYEYRHRFELLRLVLEPVCPPNADCIGALTYRRVSGNH
jgi:hypothetical protein